MFYKQNILSEIIKKNDLVQNTSKKKLFCWPNSRKKKKKLVIIKNRLLLCINI